MNVLTRNPAAGTVSASVSQYETFSDHIIRAHITRYATTEFIICHQLLRLLGLLYLDMISIHSGLPTFFFTVSITPAEITYVRHRWQDIGNQNTNLVKIELEIKRNRTSSDARIKDRRS